MFNRSLSDRLMLLAATAHCRRVLRRWGRATQQATRTQDAVLRDHLQRNAESDYGRQHGFSHIADYATYRRQVPVQDYEIMRPWIARLQHGEHHALFGGGQRVRMFALSSGTTSAPKYIPVTDRFLADVKAGWNAFGMKALLDHPGNFLKPILQITSRMDETRTAAGIPCGAITGLMAATQKRLVRKYYLTPLRVAYIDDPVARYYTIMRLAVPHRDVAFSVTANPATQLRLARTAREHGARLIRDIHDGTLSTDFPVPDDIRATLAPRLQPDRERARELEHLAARHDGLRPRDYWQLGYLCNWTGGTLGLFLQQFAELFGATPVRDIGLIASEGRMSIPTRDGSPAGTLDVTAAFFEFIPADQIDSAAPDCLRSHEVTVGAEYFILLTNAAGLYRYNIGDRIRVDGFDGEAPIIEFLSKGAHTSSMAGEKLTEHQVTAAVCRAADRAGTRLRSYVLAPRFAERPYYVLHVESDSPAPALTGLAAALDNALGAVNIEYHDKRGSDRLGAPLVHVLPAGFFEQRHHRLAQRYRAGNEQYKHQFLLTEPDCDSDFPTGRWAGNPVANDVGSRAAQSVIRSPSSC